MISNRHAALLAGLAYRDMVTLWTVWDEGHARAAFNGQIDPSISNPAYVVHLWREFELAAFSGDTRLVAAERTFTVSQVARLMLMSYNAVQTARDLMVIEGRVSAADFCVWANLRTQRQGILL